MICLKLILWSSEKFAIVALVLRIKYTFIKKTANVF